MPADALDVQHAQQLPENRPLKVSAWLLELGHECPPCPEGAACEPCQSPHPEFGDRGAPGPSAFRVIVGVKLAPADVGQHFVLAGEWGGEEDGQRVFVAQKLQRITGR